MYTIDLIAVKIQKAQVPNIEGFAKKFAKCLRSIPISFYKSYGSNILRILIFPCGYMKVNQPDFAPAALWGTP